MFKQESKADINAARERARQPLKKLCDEEAMEIDAETFYPASTGVLWGRWYNSTGFLPLLVTILKYSGDPNTGHSKSRFI